MIANVLNTGFSEGRALLSGNIGFPASTVAQTASAKDRLIMELSSFQLMGIETLHPKIAVITNIYEAHLDYHGNRSEYVRAKWRLQQNMTAEDFLVINWNQSKLVELSQQTKAKVIPFSTQQKWLVRIFLKSSYISKMRQSCLFLNWAFPADTMLKMH